MRRGDIPQVTQIAAALPEAPHWPESAYAAALESDATPRRIALVVEDGEARMWGFAVALIVAPQAELETIAVAKSAQRQGIATRLLAELFTALKRIQISEVFLEVRESNRAARAFYTRAGFAETGRRAGYYTDPKEDAILLSRALP
jgi:ribosomal-protein-alanine N-acetyltransferase